LDSQACNYNPEATLDNNSCEYALQGYDCDGNEIPHIGDQQLGGIVFYIDETGMHGLVAAIWDWAGIYEWGCYGTSISGADGQSIGTGYQNTLDIVAGCTETPIAASGALAYSVGGYSDWYLPSKDELVEMYNTIGNGGPSGNIANFFGSNYWSSSEMKSSYVWAVNFNNGNTYGLNKSFAYRVRFIRSF